MNTDYAANYRNLYVNHWWWRSREEAILRVLRQCLDTHRRERILDIGCGDGLMFDKLAKFGAVQGVEVCGDLVSDGPWRDKIHVGPFDHAFQPKGKFNLILMLDVLEHFAEPLAALQHAGRLLQPDGRLLIHVPAFRALWTSHDDVNHHYTRYTKQSLQELLTAASFCAARMQYTFYWTCPVKLAIRVKEQIVSPSHKLPQVPPPLVNAACYHLCRMEQRLFRDHSPGFGSSILAVAKPTVSVEAREDCRVDAGTEQQVELCKV